MARIQFFGKSRAKALRWRRLLLHQPWRRRAIRYIVLGANIITLAVVVGFLTLSPHTTNATDSSATATVAGDASNPLDSLSSADVAASVASVTNLPEATAIDNQAQTVKAELAVAPAENVVTAKPQVVATTFASRDDIQTYVTQPGDTITSLAAKFDITSNSILWSNNLKTTTFNPGTKLLVPPVTGIIYTVQAGDTPQSLAQKYAANAEAITSFNDAELSGLTPGEQIVIPNGQIQQTTSLPHYSSNFTAAFGSNGYDFGYCTWYVASQIAVPSNWGNASSWAYYARLSGWNVSSTPTVGAIAQTPYAAGGQGHVAIVTAVSADGSQIQYKDMNGIAGWDRVGYSGWVPASKFPNYITP